jgi:hypothetical protein
VLFLNSVKEVTGERPALGHYPASIFVLLNALVIMYLFPHVIQGDQKVSMHLMITIQKTRKNILNSFNHLP